MIDEISKELKASFYERLTDPFLRALTGSWLAWNWQPIAVLFFEDVSVTKRIAFILKTYYPNCYARLLGIAIPISVALFYTFLYPFLKVGIIKFTSWIIAWMREIKEGYENNYRLTAEQSQNIRRKYELELEQVRLISQEEINVHQHLSSELIAYYRKAHELSEYGGEAEIRQCSRQLSAGTWVSDSGHTHAEPTSNRSLGTLGVVVKIIGQRYCITQKIGIVKEIFHDLIPNETYYLDYLNPGHMSVSPPINESLKVGRAINETTFEIKIEPFSPR